MGIFSKKPMGGGMVDVIRCDQPSYLIWKWHPEGTEVGNNRKENSIRYGSSLRVKDGSVAVFVYSQPNGIVQDYIIGPYDGFLDTYNLPVISNIIGVAYAGETPFQAEVYFINLAQVIQTKIVVPYFDVYDPRFLDYGVPVAVRGTISFKITDYTEFVRLHRLDQFSMEDFQNQIKDTVSQYVKSIVANAPEEHNIPVVQIERKIEIINRLVEEKIKKRFGDIFGVTVLGIDIAAIDVDKSSEGYNQLKEMTLDLISSKMQAQNEVEIKEMYDAQKISVAERVGRMAGGSKGDSDNNNNQNLKLGSPLTKTTFSYNGGACTNSADVLPIRVDNECRQTNALTVYNVVVNGQPTGPFDLQTLRSMVMSRKLLKDSLVWTTGMESWQKACDVPDVSMLFTEMPPIPGSDK